MKTKTIWIMAILFGLLATGIFYLVVVPGHEPAVKPASGSKDLPKTEVVQAKPGQPDGPKTGNTMEIKDNARAITIPVNELQGVSGHIQAGNFVDVIVVSPPKGGPPSGQLFLQNVKVLALGNAAISSDEKAPSKDYRMATLEVGPAEGVSLALAVQNDAAIYLMLRPAGDASTVPPVQILLDGLIRKGVPK